MDSVSLFPHDDGAERSLLGAILLEPDTFLEVREQIELGDFFVPEHRRLWEAMIKLWDNGEPVDSYGLYMEAPDLRGLILELPTVVPSGLYARQYIPRLKRLARLRSYIALGADLVKRAHGDGDPDLLYAWLQERLTEIALGSRDDDALLTWEESFPAYREILAERERLAELEDAGQISNWKWPWASWDRMIDPLDPGMLALIAAPAGTGKTVYAEAIAEHWAKAGHRVVFVHFELNRALMLDRRMARAAGLPRRVLKSGRMGPEQQQRVAEAEERLKVWEGNIHYLHTPGWSMDRVIRELDRLVAADMCDAVVLDYLEKAAASDRQHRARMSRYEREADDVETFKNWGERNARRIVALAQMNKAGKKAEGSADGADIRGAGEKREKANVVVILHREKVPAGEVDENGAVVVEPGGRSRTVTVKLDKNTMGSEGEWQQFFAGETYSVFDFA